MIKAKMERKSCADIVLRGKQRDKFRLLHRETSKTSMKTDTATDRQKHRQRDSQPFRINTGALSVAQEEIIFFDVKPCVLAGVWGIEILSKQTSAPLTPSRSGRVRVPVHIQCIWALRRWRGGMYTQNLHAWYVGYAFSSLFFFSLNVQKIQETHNWFLNSSQYLSALTHLQQSCKSTAPIRSSFTQKCLWK